MLVGDYLSTGGEKGWGGDRHWLLTLKGARSEDLFSQVGHILEARLSVHGGSVALRAAEGYISGYFGGSSGVSMLPLYQLGSKISPDQRYSATEARSRVRISWGSWTR